MADRIVSEAVAIGDDDRLRAILAEVCALTQMGFAALARVTEDRWIACQVLDQIGFGLDPGSELDLKTTRSSPKNARPVKPLARPAPNRAGRG